MGKAGPENCGEVEITFVDTTSVAIPVLKLENLGIQEEHALSHAHGPDYFALRGIL